MRIYQIQNINACLKNLIINNCNSNKNHSLKLFNKLSYNYQKLELR